MEKIKTFIKHWGCFIALCAMSLTFLSFFIVGEFKCESDFLRTLIGVTTMPLCTIACVCAIFEFLSPKVGHREQ